MGCSCHGSLPYLVSNVHHQVHRCTSACQHSIAVYLVNGGEDSSGLDHIISANVSPGDLGRLPVQHCGAAQSAARHGEQRFFLAILSLKSAQAFVKRQVVYWVPASIDCWNLLIVWCVICHSTWVFRVGVVVMKVAYAALEEAEMTLKMLQS